MHVASYSDENSEKDFSKKLTSVTATNLTLINNSTDLKTEIDMGLVKEAIFVAESSSLDMGKSVISGFNPAVLFENKIKINNESLAKIKFTDMYFNNCKGNKIGRAH